MVRAYVPVITDQSLALRPLGAVIGGEALAHLIVSLEEVERAHRDESCDDGGTGDGSCGITTERIGTLCRRDLGVT